MPVVSPGSGCCLSAEGSNVEIDTCGWPENASQQAWVWQDVDTARSVPDAVTPTQTAAEVTGPSPKQLVSLWNGQCLALAGDLEVYAGPLHTPTHARPQRSTGTLAQDRRTSHRHASSARVTAATVVLFNRSPVDANMTVVFADLVRSIALAPSGRCGSVAMAVRDLWAHKDLGV